MPFPTPLSNLSLASTNRNGYKTYPNLIVESCSDCTTMPPECPGPLCSSLNTLTTQCTEQCIVIACDDPDHGESLCDREGPNNLCNCTADCHGFDSFFQCCEDYGTLQPMSSQQQPQRVMPFPWESTTSFVDTGWCDDCGPRPTNFNRSLEPNYGAVTATASQQNGALLDKVLQPTYDNPSQYHLDSSSSSSYTHVVSVPDGRPNFTCMWGSCHASFASLPELISHVNLHHLVGSPSSLDNSNVIQQHTAPKFDQMKSSTALSCLWADCSSPGISSFTDLDLLTYHLLHEHLGVTPPPTTASMSPGPVTSPLTQSTTSPTFSFDTIVHDSPRCLNDAIRVRTPSIEESSMLAGEDGDPSTCTDGHKCKWKNCPLSFSTCTELTEHITETHIGCGKGQYECFWYQCNRNGNNGFQSKQKICRHVQSHTGHRPFQCTICQQYFSEAATLQQHIRRHTQEKPYVCDYPGCGKSFAITGALTIHKRTHNGDKPFKCPHCDRGFAESSNLSKHLRTHTGVRPYRCKEPGCSKAFARPDQLNRHKSVHKRQQRGIGSNE